MTNQLARWLAQCPMPEWFGPWMPRRQFCEYTHEYPYIYILAETWRVGNFSKVWKRPKNS